VSVPGAARLLTDSQSAAGGQEGVRNLEKTFAEKRRATAQQLSIRPEQIPRHIAIIMDGNGRWAKQRSLPRAEGHRQGGKTVEKIAVHCVELGIEVLTLYSFSSENWKRPQEEIDTLMYLYRRYLVGIRPMLMRNNVRLVHLGRLERLAADLIDELSQTIEMTAANTGMVLALALNYGGRDEIIDSIKDIAREYKEGKIDIDDIDQDCVNQHLYTSELIEPDLLIRTANEMRVSNFLLWQISYTEFYVAPVLWPDFTEQDLEKALLDYSKRIRRFGKTESQLQSG
jgi:undecaprenyl diphosphate synthase